MCVCYGLFLCVCGRKREKSERGKGGAMLLGGGISSCLHSLIFRCQTSNESHCHSFFFCTNTYEERSRIIFENDNNYLLGSNLNPISRVSNDIKGSMDYVGDIYASLFLHVAFKAYRFVNLF